MEVMHFVKTLYTTWPITNWRFWWLIYLCKGLVNMFMMDKRHSRVLAGILRWMQIHGRWGVCTNLTGIKWWHHGLWMSISNPRRYWLWSPWPRYMMRKRSWLVFSRKLRSMSGSKLWKLSVVIHYWCIHWLQWVWSTIEPKPRIKSLHIPAMQVTRNDQVNPYSKSPTTSQPLYLLILQSEHSRIQHISSSTRQ